MFQEFLENRKEEIIRDFEDGRYGSSVEEFNETLAELRLLKRYREMTNKMIQLGDIAEERMKEIGE